MNEKERIDVMQTLEGMIWITDPRRALRPQRVRAIVGQMAKTALQNLRRPRLLK
jgi:hypothetical protein